MRCQNILTGRSVGPGRTGTTKVAVGQAKFLVPGTHAGQVRFAIRPENLCLTSADAVRADQGGAVLAVELSRSVDLGAYVRVELVGAVALVAHLSHPAFTEVTRSGQTSFLVAVYPETVHVLSPTP